MKKKSLETSIKTCSKILKKELLNLFKSQEALNIYGTVQQEIVVDSVKTCPKIKSQSIIGYDQYMNCALRKLLIILVAVLLTASVFAQAPQKMSYQAVIRNSSNALVTNASVNMKISILQNATPVYVETQTSTTNINGLVTIEIGSGTVLLGAFASINWAIGPYFIKTETDPSGGLNYSIIGTSELLSVPYALFAANTASATIANNTITASMLQSVSGALINGPSGSVLQSDGTGKFGWLNISSGIPTDPNNLLLTNGSFYVGDISGKASATAKNYIPISGFASPIANVLMGDGVINFKITNLNDPTDNQDAATKKYVDDSRAVIITGNVYQGLAADVSAFNGLSWTDILSGTNLGTSIRNPICDLNASNYTWIAFPKAWGKQNFFYRYGTPTKVSAVLDGYEIRLIPAAVTGSVDYLVWVFKTKPNVTVNLIINN